MKTLRGASMQLLMSMAWTAAAVVAPHATGAEAVRESRHGQGALATHFC